MPPKKKAKVTPDKKNKGGNKGGKGGKGGKGSDRAVFSELFSDTQVDSKEAQAQVDSKEAQAQVQQDNPKSASPKSQSASPKSASPSSASPKTVVKSAGKKPKAKDAGSGEKKISRKKQIDLMMVESDDVNHSKEKGLDVAKYFMS